MTLEQYSNLADIIGVILIVASLAYVGRQLRQNTEMMRANASTQRVERDAELNSKVSDSQEFAEIWLRGASAFDSLSEVQQTRLMFFNRPAIVHWNNMFNLRSKNLLPDSDWKELTCLLRLVGSRQDTRAAWIRFRGSFSGPFQEFVEAELGAAEPLS